MIPLPRMPWVAAVPRPRYLAGFSLAAGVLLAVCSSRSVSAQAPVTIKPEASQSGQTLKVDILAHDAVNLAGFQMVLSWDPALLTFIDVKAGSFLSSTGRQPLCLDPAVDSGAVRYACATTQSTQAVGGAAPTPAATGVVPTLVPGAGGTGVIAELQFKVIRGGEVKLGLSHVILADPPGKEIASQTADTTVSVTGPGGTSWVIWLFVVVGALVVVAGAVFVVIRRRSRGQTMRPPESAL